MGRRPARVSLADVALMQVQLHTTIKQKVTLAAGCDYTCYTCPERGNRRRLTKESDQEAASIATFNFSDFAKLVPLRPSSVARWPCTIPV